MKFVLGIIAAAFLFTAAPAGAQESTADKVAKAEAADKVGKSGGRRTRLACARGCR